MFYDWESLVIKRNFGKYFLLLVKDIEVFFNIDVNCKHLSVSIFNLFVYGRSFFFNFGKYLSLIVKVNG